MTNKTRAELEAIVEDVISSDWSRADIVDALTEAIGYEPAPEPPTYEVAPEPPTYEVGTIARVTDGEGFTYIAEWVGVAWVRTKDSRGGLWDDLSRQVTVEVIPTYDPSHELVIPLDKVPQELDDWGVTIAFLRLVADLAEQARNRGE